MPTACSGPTWFSQINSPVFASSACRMLRVFARYMTPLWTSGIGWFAPPSCIAHTHASRKSFTLARVISASGL
jgi:hypothetical protein